MDVHDGDVSTHDWPELRSAWSSYSSAVEVWLDAAAGDASLVARADLYALTHAVIAAHQRWTEGFLDTIRREAAPLTAAPRVSHRDPRS